MQEIIFGGGAKQYSVQEYIGDTSTTKEAIKLVSSETIPYHNLVLQDVKLTFNGHGKGGPTNTCNNAEAKEIRQLMP
jgi:hypothetical protein